MLLTQPWKLQGKAFFKMQRGLVCLKIVGKLRCPIRMLWSVNQVSKCCKIWDIWRENFVGEWKDHFVTLNFGKLIRLFTATIVLQIHCLPSSCNFWRMQKSYYSNPPPSSVAKGSSFCFSYFHAFLLFSLFPFLNLNFFLSYIICDAIKFCKLFGKRKVCGQLTEMFDMLSDHYHD